MRLFACGILPPTGLSETRACLHLPPLCVLSTELCTQQMLTNAASRMASLVWRCSWSSPTGSVPTWEAGSGVILRACLTCSTRSISMIWSNRGVLSRSRWINRVSKALQAAGYSHLESLTKEREQRVVSINTIQHHREPDKYFACRTGDPVQLTQSGGFIDTGL